MIWTGIYFVHKWMERGQQVDTIPEHYGKGVSPGNAQYIARPLQGRSHRTQLPYPKRPLFVHEAGMPPDNLLQQPGGRIPPQQDITLEHAHKNYIKEVAELPQEIFGLRNVGQDHPYDQSDSAGSSLNKNRMRGPQSNGGGGYKHVISKCHKNNSQRERDSLDLPSPVLGTLPRVGRSTRQSSSRLRCFEGIQENPERQYKMDEISSPRRQVKIRGEGYDKDWQQRYEFTQWNRRRENLRDIGTRPLTTSKAPP